MRYVTVLDVKSDNIVNILFLWCGLLLFLSPSLAFVRIKRRIVFPSLALFPPHVPWQPTQVSLSLFWISGTNDDCIIFGECENVLITTCSISMEGYATNDMQYKVSLIPTCEQVVVAAVRVHGIESHVYRLHLVGDTSEDCCKALQPCGRALSAVSSSWTAPPSSAASSSWSLRSESSCCSPPLQPV